MKINPRLTVKFWPILIIYLVVASFVSGMYAQQLIVKNKPPVEEKKQEIDLDKLTEKVLPNQGFVFTIRWGDLGKKLVADGVIDEVKLAKAVTGADTLPANLKKYLDDSKPQAIELNRDNAHFWVDVLWALGLAQKSDILDSGQMKGSGDPANFASTGGYTLGRSDAMNYYSKFSYISLTDDQKRQVEEIAQNVYRPCCGNSTAFPDCNHGMAALGLIELMVSQGFSQGEIYKTVLAFNSFWFPQTYLDLSYHFAKNNKDFSTTAAKDILAKTFSSASGYNAVKRQIGQVDWPSLKGGGSCGA